MNYCPRCQILAEGKCPVCGRKARAAEPTDPVLLLITDALHADLAEPVLDENDIPYARMGRLGAGLTMYTSPQLETYRFLVPYESLSATRALLAETFGEDAQFMEGLSPDPNAQ